MLIMPTPTPPNVALSHIPTSGDRPVSGFRLSCMQLTEPLLVQVVTTAHNGAAPAPKRSSLPSRLPTSWATGSPANAAVGADSVHSARPSLAASGRPITANSTAACRMRPTIRPKVQTAAIGSSMIAIVDTTLVQKVGFSNGCVLLGPKKPPPLVPSCLIATNAATGPRQITCTAPSNVVAGAAPANVIGTPPSTSKIGRAHV